MLDEFKGLMQELETDVKFKPVAIEEIFNMKYFVYIKNEDFTDSVIDTIKG